MKIYRLNRPNFSPRAGVALNGELHLQSITVVVVWSYTATTTLHHYSWSGQHHIRLLLSQCFSNQLATVPDQTDICILTINNFSQKEILCYKLSQLAG